jgi:hypothetical protein
MRIQIEDSWIAGHPDYEPGEWTSANNLILLPTRAGGWTGGPGWERLQYEDTGCPAFSIRFDVSRVFATQTEVADFITSLHSDSPPHPWEGEVTLHLDDPEGGAGVEIDAGWCVVELAGPVRALGGGARLTQVISYLIHGGVLGEQPDFTEGEIPGDTNYTWDHGDE